MDTITVTVAVIGALASGLVTNGISDWLLRLLGKKTEKEDDPVKKFRVHLQKLDVAKKNISDALASLQEMTSAIGARQGELASLMDEIESVSNEKEELETRLGEIRRMKDADVRTVQETFGVPTAGDRRKDRFVGFISGVIASIVATYIYTNGPAGLSWVSLKAGELGATWATPGDNETRSDE